LKWKNGIDTDGAGSRVGTQIFLDLLGDERIVLFLTEVQELILSYATSGPLRRSRQVSH
jgi:hypothetical protein